MARARIDFPSRVGVWWTSENQPITHAVQVARDIEALNYGSLFYGEAFGKEALTQAGAFLGATERLVIGTGIANIHARDAIAAEAGGRTLTALHPGRFVLGLGVSHASLVEDVRGGSYGKPLATMRDYLERMAALDEEVEPKADRPTRVLAALGPRMTALARELTDGAHPTMITPEQTGVTREAVGPDKWVIAVQLVALTGDRETALQRAHAHLDFYSQLPNYRNFWLRQGFDDSDLERGGSERLAEAMVARGEPDAVADAVNAHLDAGADHVLLHLLGDDDSTDPRPTLRKLSHAHAMRRN